jgi:putative phosphoribosyl transferase
MSARSVEIPAPPARLSGELWAPSHPSGLVAFAHGSGSSRLSTRTQRAAAAFNKRGLATLLFDLLTTDEESDRTNVFDVGLLTERLLAATRWALTDIADGMPIGYFGASTGSAAALCAAGELGDRIGAVVSHGGRPDMAGDCLGLVTAPTLLIVGGADRKVLALNDVAAARLTCRHGVEIVPGATHLFEEPGALERVCELASEWFVGELASPVQ